MSVAFVQGPGTITPQSARTSATSPAFTATAGDAILHLGLDWAGSGLTVSFSGTGSYAVITPPGQFSDTNNNNTFTWGWNSSATAGSQTATATGGAGDTMFEWVLEYSGVSTASGAGTLRATPGTGSGAITGAAQTIPTGGVLVAICFDSSGGQAVPTSPSGTNRGSGANNTVQWCCTEYTAAGSTTPTFTCTTGATSNYVVMQMLLSPPVGPTINTQPANDTIYDGSVAQFTVSATTSGGALSYQWQDNRTGSFANTTDGTGATSATYTTPQELFSANGRQYLVNVTDSNGTTTSNAATLIVIPYTTQMDPRRATKKQSGGTNWGLNSAEWW